MCGSHREVEKCVAFELVKAYQNGGGRAARGRPTGIQSSLTEAQLPYEALSSLEFGMYTGLASNS